MIKSIEIEQGCGHHKKLPNVTAEDIKYKGTLPSQDEL